jgi:hypothetical protein
MITTSIKIKPYLREFLLHAYGEEPLRFPDSSDLLAFVHELRIKRPTRATGEPVGNLLLAIPFQKHGKDPRQYNYLTPRSQRVIQNKVNTLFTATMNDYVARKVHVLGLEYREAIELFIEEYGIDSISFEGLKQKNYRDRSGKRYRRENRFKRIKNVKNEDFPTDLDTQKVAIVSPGASLSTGYTCK